MREHAARFIEGGLTSGRRGRRQGTHKVHPLIVVGLVQYLIESGRVNNREKAFGKLEELGVIPYKSGKDSFYRALREQRFRAVLIELPDLAKEDD